MGDNLPLCKQLRTAWQGREGLGWPVSRQPATVPRKGLPAWRPWRGACVDGEVPPPSWSERYPPSPVPSPSAAAKRAAWAPTPHHSPASDQAGRDPCCAPCPRLPSPDPAGQAAIIGICLLATYSGLEVGPRSAQRQPVRVALPATSVRWTPTKWDQLSQEKKLAAWQAISVLLSWLDEPEGKFPDASSSCLMDDYSFMAFLGSGVSPKPQDKADRALGELRVRNHQALKTASAKDLQLEAELVASVQGSRASGPARRWALLHQLEATNSRIPLRPIWKSVLPPPPPPPKSPKPSVDMYSPTRPEI